ncbi:MULTISPECIES: DUF4013 domain-containing protein [Halorubrum]|uniref:DUF4013 domain-containing protein n=1 Tax=Halorubrum hochstenium ATCC 700873 TaxID=1227481 RepID=M0F8S4_9EURY|nr:MULTISPECIES: DUF4013 domain-containing protein [Halorubrum]ELZ55627.1 hypothetical protein C467_09269 [Halorubrum hochstenium ATCC 700873]
MIEASLNYLRDGDDALVTVLIGGVLLLASPLLIPAFAVFGYVVRVLRRTADGDAEPPVFDAWGDLLVDGLKGFAVAFVYSLLPLGVVAVAAVIGLGAFVAVPGGESVGAGTVVVGLTVLVAGLVALALSLVGLYVTPAALAAVADSGKVGDGFALGTLWGVVTSRAYATGWLAAAVVVLAGSLAIGVLSVVPVLGTVAGVFVQFYALVAAAAIIGWTWGDVRPTGTEPPGPEPAERPAV